MAIDSSGAPRLFGFRTSWAMAACCALIAALVALAVLANARQRVTVEFTVQAQAPALLQVFQHERGQFSERWSQWYQIGATPQRLVMSSDGRDARHLRFDPPAGVDVRLCGPKVEGFAERERELATELTVEPAGDCMLLLSRADAADPRWQMAFAGAAEKRLRQARTWHRLLVLSVCGILLLVPALAWLAWLSRASLPRQLGELRATLGFEKLEARLHWVVAVLMLMLGAGYVFTTPPGAVADEEAHLGKVIRIAHGSAFGHSPQDQLLPDPRRMYGPYFSNYLTNRGPLSRDRLAKRLEAPLSCARVTTGVTRYADAYFPHQYLLPAIVFRGSCATEASFGTFLYLSRLLNLLLATALVAFGVAQAQRGKWGLVAIALLPMSMFQMASLSADSLTLGLSLAWVGLVSGVAGGSVAPGRARWALGALAYSIALLKPGAAWILAGLLFCRPAYRAAGTSFPRALALFVVLPWVLHVAWTLYSSSNAVPPQGIEPRENLQYMLSHPLAFPSALVQALSGDSFVLTLQRVIGVLGWLDVYLPNWAYQAGSLALVLGFCCGRPTTMPASRFTYPLAIVFAIGSVVLIALPFYLYWTQLAAPIIRGMQGRYFLPTLAWLMAWCSWRSPTMLRALLALGLIAALLAINVEALRVLDWAFFVKGR